MVPLFVSRAEASCCSKNCHHLSYRLCVVWRASLSAAAMEVKVLVVLAVLIALGCCDDLSGIRVDGNKFVNHANQTVKLMVRELC